MMVMERRGWDQKEGEKRKESRVEEKEREAILKRPSKFGH